MRNSLIRIAETSSRDLDRLHLLVSQTLALDKVSPGLLHEKLFFNPHPERDVYQTLMAEMDGDVVGMLQHVMRPADGLAWLGLFAVDPRHRRRGIAKRMYDVALESWRRERVRQVDVLTIPSNYLVPGVDPRYTAALCFLESLGFADRAHKANMRAWLDRDFDTTSRERELRRRGIEIRRASSEDGDRLDRFFAATFGQGWLDEVHLSMRRDPPAVHLALRDSEIVAFAAHSSMNQELGNFGPMGTAEAFLGQGIGRILLYRCMSDLASAGFESVIIPWIGPYRFYANALNSAIDRVFWQYRLSLAPAG